MCMFHRRPGPFNIDEETIAYEMKIHSKPREWVIEKLEWLDPEHRERYKADHIAAEAAAPEEAELEQLRAIRAVRALKTKFT